jgi:hypothetical protein
MIGLGVRQRWFDIGGVGKLTGPGARVTPKTQRRDIQRNEDEHRAEDPENAIVHGAPPFGVGTRSYRAPVMRSSFRASVMMFRAECRKSPAITNATTKSGQAVPLHATSPSAMTMTGAHRWHGLGAVRAPGLGTLPATGTDRPL